MKKLLNNVSNYVPNAENLLKFHESFSLCWAERTSNLLKWHLNQNIFLVDIASHFERLMFYQVLFADFAKLGYECFLSSCTKTKTGPFPIENHFSKTSFWMRKKHFSVTQICFEFHQNKSEIITVYWNISHLISACSLPWDYDNCIQEWRGAPASLAFSHKLLAGVMGRLRSAALSK